MKCADPVLCYRTSKGKKIYRNFSFIKKNTLFLQNAQTVFNCGKCLFCRKKRAYELALRCVLHASLYKDNCFLTLTYDENKKDYHNEFQYEDIQKFKKRLRSYCSNRCDSKRVEIFNVHEYGKNGKKHWHLVVFNHDFSDKKFFTQRSGIPLYSSESLSKLWPFGFSSIGDVTEASAMYTAQYMEKDFKNQNSHSTKKSHSKHSGIGKGYFLKHYKQILTLGFIPMQGKKIPIPRYFLKLANKHYCHYYEPDAFFDNQNRKAKHRPFKNNEQNQEIADLYVEFIDQRQSYLKELENEWNETLNTFLTTNTDPDFIIANQNSLHDLRNKQTMEKF